jgi:hypothetical protein
MQIAQRFLMRMLSHPALRFSFFSFFFSLSPSFMTFIFLLFFLFFTASQSSALETTRIGRPIGPSFRMETPGAAVFFARLHTYAFPSTCTMVLCNGACTGRADACDALVPATVLNLQIPGELNCTRSCRTMLSRHLSRDDENSCSAACQSTSD